jgi:hypothetical protein
VAWVGGFFAYGGKGAEQSATINFAVPPGELLDEGAMPIRSGDVFVLPEGTSHGPPQHRLGGSADHRLLLQAAGRAALGRGHLATGWLEGHRFAEPRLITSFSRAGHRLVTNRG